MSNRCIYRYIETRVIVLSAAFFLTAAISLFVAGMIAFYGCSGALLIIPLSLFIIEGIAACFWIIRPYRQTKRLLALFTSGYSLSGISGISYPFNAEMEALQKNLSGLLGGEPLKTFSKRQAQFLALQNQINPHFLYNTLEGIRSEALIAGLENVARMTEALLTFFRYTISRTEHLVSLQMELDNTRNYFFIQQYRFGDRLNLSITMEEEECTRILQCRLPKLTLQPIVENSIVHGLERKKGKGMLNIRVIITADRLLITVSDDGVGMNEQTLEDLRNRLIFRSLDYVKTNAEPYRHSGIALENVNNRIKLLFGEEYGLSVESTAGVGTDVHISLPAVFEWNSV